jgi:UDP-glucose 4-epimerase
VEIGSVLDRDTVEKAVDGKDLVIHLAGIAEPDQYCTHPKAVIDLTLEGSLNVIRTCARRGVGVIFASTSEVYGHNPAVPWSEQADRVLGPTSVNRWCYSSAKAVIEHYLFACHQEDDLDFVIARLFNVYGPGLKGRVVARFIEQALNDEPLTIHGDGSQTRTFLYIADAIAALRAIISAGRLSSKAYNIGDVTPVSILELARMILNMTESRSPLEFIDVRNLPEGFSDIMNRVPVTELVREEFRWKPMTSLATGLVQTINGFNRDAELRGPTRFVIRRNELIGADSRLHRNVRNYTSLHSLEEQKPVEEE